MLLLTHLIMPMDKVITQTIFVVLFTSGSLSHLGETLRCLIWHLPRYLSPTYSQFTTFSFCRYNMMTEYTFFSQGCDRWGKDLALLWGHLGICITSINQSELSSLTGLMAWGAKRNPTMTLPFSSSLPRSRQQTTESMVFPPYG